MRRTLVATLVGMLGMGCAAAHEPRDVGSGIYDLVVRGDGDACSPTRATGAMGLVGVVSSGGLVNVAVPDGAEGTLARVSLSARDDFHTEATIAVPGCDGTMLRRGWTILEASPSGFQLELTEEWIGLAGCSLARHVMPLAPEGDCRAERVLEYRLMQSCGEGCEVQIAGGVPACVCR